MDERDFTSRSSFPGTAGNPFDVTLHGFEGVQKLHPVLFAILLFLLSLFPFLDRWLHAIWLCAFFLIDWLLLSLLPHFHRSFGPPKPPALILALLRLPFAFLPLPFAIAFQVVGSLMVIYAFWFEPFHLTITRQTLTSPKLHSSEPLRLLHLGDLHIERISHREMKLNQLIADLKPDAILFSGDFLNLSYRSDPAAIQAARTVISQWHAPLGVFVVSGSPAVDLPEITPDLLHGLSVNWLQDSKTEIKWNQDTIELIGLTCTHRPHVDGAKLAALCSSPSQNLRILLYHSPDLAPVAAKHDVDLQLSGHTHGGQVRLPLIGALFTGSLYGKRFEAGRYQLDQLILYITRGLGLEGAAAPRVRFLCPPEVILWEIIKE